jgi:hypothetical protein
MYENIKTKKGEILRDLGDGLILRRATKADTQALSTFNANIHGNPERNEPDERVGVWTQDLMERPHPTFDVGDFTIVEDTRTGTIVSTLNLISQTWSYAGIPFGVGRPELVGTDPEYRNRGLVRAQFEVIHRWSAERGHKMQAITGIPFYYRLFGYEMALSLGGGRVGYKPQVPKLKDGEKEPYRLRPALQADIPFISELYRRACKRYLVNCVWDDELWRYELNGKSSQNVDRMELRLIENASGKAIGYLAHPALIWGDMLAAVAYEVSPDASMADVTPSVVRYLYTTGKTYAAAQDKSDEFAAFGFWMGQEHPVYQVLHDGLPRLREPYAWYVRIPDLPDFLRHIAAVLEKRLAGSIAAGHTGELKLTFYRTGLRLVFERGKLVGVEEWEPAPQGHSGDAAFPNLTFLQLLLGYRSLEELEYAYADCWHENDRVFALLNTLFPKQNSDIWPVS